MKLIAQPSARIIRLPDALHRRVKTLAAAEARPLSELAAALLADALDRRQDAPDSAPREPRT